jgi:hypothetical protein
MNGYSYIAVPGQGTIALTATNNTLNVLGQGGLTIATNTSTNTLTFNLSSQSLSVANFTVTSSLNINPTTLSTLDNITIGATTPSTGVFSTLATTGAVTLSPANANITISPTGTGTLVVNPAVTGNIDNVIIGATTPVAGSFSSITLTTTQPNTINSAVTKGYVAALSAAYGVALS